ncbi:hypothetical protein C8Q80DRAFT_321036 [Daedaleopsis nitida]|nr:hypothetical protein C8Q80DRAFT_321036 [Daedaleopsis nitida]
MDLFSGYACFSPDIPDVVKDSWVKYGGSIASLPSENSSAHYIFCDGTDDPWLNRFYERSMAVFHWSWITAAVQAQFRIPISSYILGEFLARAASSVGNLSWTEPRTGSLHSCAQHKVRQSCSEDSDLALVEDCLKIGRKYDALEGDTYDQGITRWMDGVPEPDSPNMKPTEPTVDPRLVLHDVEDITLVWEGDHSGDIKALLGSTAFVSDVSRSGVAAVSVSDALRCLRDVSTDGAVQFIPGTIHLGKEFQCWFA